MRLSLKLAVCFLGATVLAGVYPADEVDQLAATALGNWQSYLASNPAKGNCTFANAVKRQEW